MLWHYDIRVPKQCEETMQTLFSEYPFNVVNEIVHSFLSGLKKIDVSCTVYIVVLQSAEFCVMQALCGVIT